MRPDIPRVRQIIHMGNQAPLTKEKIESDRRWIITQTFSDLCHAFPRFSLNPGGYVYSKERLLYEKKYIDRKAGDIHWDKLHGWKRKNAKFAIKSANKRFTKQVDVFNKYAGRSDVVLIYARVGGRNWYNYDCKRFEKEPWFLEKVDDPYDDTYCDIYVLKEEE